MSGRVTIVDDDPDLCDVIALELRRLGLDVACHGTGESAYRAILDGGTDIVVTDLRLPDADGIDLCRRIREARPEVQVIVITAFGSLESAVAAIRAGAYDFVTKPVEMEILGIAVDRAMRHRRLEREVESLNEALARTRQFEELLGESPPMQRLFDQLRRIAESDASVLLTGESGTGKELAARALHRRSARHDGPFVGVNCSALPETLLESELFGHVRGAFTDARADRSGLFVQADGGVLFLDEIGDVPLALQPKLLRALEERKVRPIGGTGEVEFDVRIVSATNRDLESAVEDGSFREDLYFRVNVIQAHLPPLRVRGTDVLLLAQHWLEELGRRRGASPKGLSRSVAERLLAYDWPGNVRELKNAVEHAVALTRFEEITVEDLPRRIREHRVAELNLGGANPDDLLPMSEVERRYIHHVLQATGGNKTLAARILGFDRKTLYRKLAR